MERSPAEQLQFQRSNIFTPDDTEGLDLISAYMKRKADIRVRRHCLYYRVYPMCGYAKRYCLFR